MSTGMDYLAQNWYIKSHGQKYFQNRILSIMTDCQGATQQHIHQHCTSWSRALTWNNVWALHFEGPHRAKDNIKIAH
jgi:hypothetical protein